MVKHECPTCKYDFKKKCNLENHLSKKNKCIQELDDTQNNTKLPQNNTQIDHNILNVTMPTKNDLDCNYCNKSFARKDALTRHMNQYCPVAKQQNKEKQEIFDKLLLLETKNKQLEEEIKNKNDKLETKNKQLEAEIKNKDKEFKNEIKNLKKEMKKIQPVTNNTQNNNNINIGNTTNIIMVSYGHEDLSKITPKMLSSACKKGYNSIVQLVETVHFNPDFPENHNVYIPSVKDKHAMVYYDDMWNLKNKDDVVNDMYDTNRDYIMENIEGISNLLNDGEKRALNRWLDSEKNKDKSNKDKKAIEITHENLKLLLHNKRHIPVGTRKQKAAIAN